MGRLPAGLFVVMLCGSCRSGPAAYVQNLHSPNPGDRIRAIADIAENRNRQAVPHLVDRLEDEDEGVRFYTILALEKIEGTRLGYDYAKNDVARARAVKRWRQYLREGRHQATASAEAKPDGRDQRLEGGP